MAKSPTPDEFGRFRVVDEDTGHERSIHAAELPHGNYRVLNASASDVCGEAVPESLSSHPASGRSADTSEENAND